MKSEYYGLSIDFPEIIGASERQEWYAHSLRDAYISQHIQRFQEIDDITNHEVDLRMKYGAYSIQFDCPTYMIDLNEFEKVCLFSVDAGTIIGKLKEWRNIND